MIDVCGGRTHGLEDLDPHYFDAFERMCRRFTGADARELCAFWPVIGRRFETSAPRVLLVGRATNAWEPGLDADEARTYSDVSKAGQFVEADAYARRSAFWRAARGTLAALGFDTDAAADHRNDWMQVLTWTNLFKVAPRQGGNPSQRVRDLIRDDCVELLGREVDALKPSVVLVFAGADWFEAFGQGLGVALEPSAGRFVGGVAQARGARWVVAKHPMGKPHAEFVAELTAALRRKD